MGHRRACTVSGLLLLALGWCPFGENVFAGDKTRLMLVDSYHGEFLWSQYTNRGFCDGLLKFGYLDNEAQVMRCFQQGEAESSTTIVKRIWMDTKRKSSKQELMVIAPQVTQAVKVFHPDLLFLGDDNAANYIGTEFLDTKMPIVVWGINNNPVKYGLIDSSERPGHNVTAVVEVKYFQEGIELLKTLVPQVKKFAILSDATDTGRANAKAAELLAQQNAPSFTLVESVSTNEFEVFKQRTLELQGQVDAFVVLPTTMKDPQGQFVSDQAIIQWYLTHVHKPEVASSRRGVTLGLLCAADPDGYRQGYEGARIAHDILANGANPATYPTVTPKRGPLMVNRQRAQMLGIVLPAEPGMVQEYIDQALALQDSEASPKPSWRR